MTSSPSLGAPVSHSDLGTRTEDRYSPINLPRISFMSPEHGTGGHAGSSEGKDSLQMNLFDGEDDDRL